MKENNYKCSECGSNDVQSVMWVNHLTGEPDGYFPEDDVIDDELYNYCKQCNKNVILKLNEK